MNRSKFIRMIVVPVALASGAIAGHFRTVPAVPPAPPVERAWGPTIRVVGRVSATSATLASETRQRAS